MIAVTVATLEDNEVAECECMAGCPFFNDKMSDNAGLGAIYKHKYCLGDNTNCARYQVKVALGKAKVPPTLYPNMWDKAKDIIALG
jgi:hypothetical protein